MANKKKVISLEKKTSSRTKQTKKPKKPTPSTRLRCPICDDNRIIPVKKDLITEHLIVTLDSANHYHIHGPIENSKLIMDFILKIAEEAGIEIEGEE